MNNKQWILSKRPVNKLSSNNFEWVESEVEVINDGEFLVKNLFLSFEVFQCILTFILFGLVQQWELIIYIEHPLW